MAGISPYTKAFIMVIFFSFCILEFVGNYVMIKNPSSSIYDSKWQLNQSINSFQSTITMFEMNVSQAQGKMANAEPSATDYLFLIFQGAFEIPKIFLAVIVNGEVGLSYILFPGLGGTGWGALLSTGITLLLTTLVFTFIFLLIKFIRSGESER